MDYYAKFSVILFVHEYFLLDVVFDVNLFNCLKELVGSQMHFFVADEKGILIDYFQSIDANHTLSFQ